MAPLAALIGHPLLRFRLDKIIIGKAQVHRKTKCLLSSVVRHSIFMYHAEFTVLGRPPSSESNRVDYARQLHR